VRRLTAITLLLVALPAWPAEHYRAADMQADGRLRLTTTHGAVRWAPSDRNAEPEPQSAFDEPRIAPDGATVGWLAMYPGCCQSYPLPLALVLYRDGHALRSMTGAGMPIWHWRFVHGGRDVAFVQRPSHGAAPDHYELRDIASGRLRAQFDQVEDAHTPLPRWARGVMPADE
jgi:hypothetical protein